MEESTTKQEQAMEKFDFLLGDWDLEYRVPKSAFSEAATGTGTGIFKRALDDKYVLFDYSCSLTTGDGQAHAVFAWDEKAKLHRFWWFENSGNFAQATCSFMNDETLLLSWHDSLFIQNFRRIDPNKVILRMEHPTSEGEYELALEVTFIRR